MERKILVTGAGGFLGSRIAKHFDKTDKVIPCYHCNLDITDEKSVMQNFLQHRPQVVFHCAAVADTGFAEQNPEKSHAINVQGSVNVAHACNAIGAKLVYMSSDQVYNGCQSLIPSSENDELSPENVYAKDKLLAEKNIHEILPQAVGLRLTWLYDLQSDNMPLNNNFLVKLINANRQKTPLSMAVREYRGFTWTKELVENLDKIINLDGGVYNCGCTNNLNSYETAVKAAKILGCLDTDFLIKADSERFANHVRNISMNIDKIKSCGISFNSSLQTMENCLKYYNLI